jgi:hypothetical protein
LTYGGVTQTSPQNGAIILLPDTTPPSIPTGLSATVISTTQINLTCNTATDPAVVGATTSGLAGYKWRRDGGAPTTTVPAAFSATGLTANTQYSFTASAIDAAGNESAQSSAVLATTQSTGTGNIITPVSNQNLAATTTPPAPAVLHVQNAIDSAPPQHDECHDDFNNGPDFWRGAHDQRHLGGRLVLNGL